MNLQEIKHLLKFPTWKAEGKKPHPILIWSIVVAILFLAISGFSNDDKKENSKKEDETNAAQFSMVQEDYVSRMEERLIYVLKEIEGAGKVQVFLNIDSNGSKALAMDIKTESEKRTEEKENENHHQKEETVVFMEDNSGQNPYVIEEKMPQPSGVLVVAEGARDEHVRVEMYEAVKALFGLAAHRIKVTY